MRAALILLGVISATLSSGCGSSTAPRVQEVDYGPRGPCNPVQDSHCLLPYPSSFFLTPDEDTDSGQRIDFAQESLPESLDGVPLRPAYLNERDGFPLLGSLLAHFPGVSLEGLVGHQDIESFLDEDVRSVILNAETGERLPHFVELEHIAADSGRQLLLLRPVVPMQHSTRYVVGLRGLRDSSGQPLPAPRGFATLRDKAVIDATLESDLARQQSHYDAKIFPVLARAGFERPELQLAWDFVTHSRRDVGERMRWIRDDALDEVGAAGPSYAIEQVLETDCDAEPPPAIGRSVRGSFRAPLYLDNEQPGSFLNRDEAGMPFRDGQTHPTFLVQIPCSLIRTGRPGRLVQFGHGMFGSEDELLDDYLGELAHRFGWIMFATGWTGMMLPDVSAIGSAIINDRTDFRTVPERSHQGFVHALLAGRMMQGDLADDPALAGPEGSLVDRSQLNFYGISQGAILGGAYVAMSPDIERAALGVGGMGFSFIALRADPFKPFLGMLEGLYPDYADISLLLPLFQILWDSSDSAGWSWLLEEAALDGLPDKEVLIQTAIGDASVTTLAAHIMARAYGAKLVQPATRPVWGLEEAQPPFRSSALVEFDYGVPEPVEAQPADAAAGAHERVRREASLQEQMRVFFETGEIQHFCEGRCVRP